MMELKKKSLSRAKSLDDKYLAIHHIDNAELTIVCAKKYFIAEKFMSHESFQYTKKKTIIFLGSGTYIYFRTIIKSSSSNTVNKTNTFRFVFKLKFNVRAFGK